MPYIVKRTRLTLDTSSVKKHFLATDSFTYSGLVVTAHYDLDSSHQDVCPAEIVTSSCEVYCSSFTPGKNRTVTVKFVDDQSGDTLYSYYNINKDGVSELIIDISNVNNQTTKYDSTNDCLVVDKGNGVNYTGLQAQVRRYSDGVLGSPSSVLASAVTKPNVDTSSVGEQQATLSYTEDGFTVTKKITIKVVEQAVFKEYKVVDAPTKFYVRDNVMPTFAFGRIYAVYSDGSEIELTYGASTNGFSTSPTLGSTLQRGFTEVTVTSTVTTKNYKYNIEVIDDYPTSDAELSVEGLDSNGLLPYHEGVYQRGEQLVKQGLVVKASKWSSGDKNKRVDDFTLTIRNKNTDIFGNDWAFGKYDVVVSVTGVTDTEILTNAVILDGPVSVTGLTSNKTYKSGEELDKEQISGTIVYSGGKRTAIVPKDIYTSVTALHYGEDETVPLTIAGEIETTLNVVIKKVTGISLTLKTGKTAYYNYGDKFQRDNYIVTKTYSDGSTEQIDPALLELDGINENYLEAEVDDNVVPVTVSYTEDSFEVETEITIYVKRIYSVLLLDSDSNSVDTLVYNYGENIDLTPYNFQIRYNDDTIDYIYGNDIQLTKNSKIITNTAVKNKITDALITARCGTDSQSVNLTIHIIYLSGITVNFSSLPTLYAYELLDLSDITATKTYASTDEEDENYPQTSICTSQLGYTFNGINVSGLTSFYLPGAGNNQVLRAILTENGQTVYQDQPVNVLAVTLSSIVIHKAASFKPLSSYIVDEYLDLTGLTVDIIYNRTASNKMGQPITNFDLKIVDSADGEFKKTEKILATHNNTELFVKYTEGEITRTASIGTLEVGAKAISSISFVQREDESYATPTKTTFTYGDIFNIEGAVLKASFNNGTEEVIPVSQLSVSGVTIGHTFLPPDDTLGEKTITISFEYNGVTKTVTYTITLVAPQIDYLTTNVNDGSGVVRTTYQDGSLFSESTIVVTAVMQNGWAIPLSSFLSNATTVLGIGNDGLIDVDGAYGYKTITLTGTNPYNQLDAKTVTYDIEVTTSGQVINALLKLEGDYDKYIVGEKFTARGVSFIVTDIDGNTWTATNIITEPSIDLVFRSAQRIRAKATYINGSFVKTEEFDIIVSVPNSVDITETDDYQLAIGKANGDLFTEITHEEATIKLGKVYDENNVLLGEFYPLFHEDKISIDDNPLHTNTVGFNVYTGADAEHDCIGYIDLGSGDVRNAHVVLFDDPVNPIDGDSNIEVLFPHYVPSYADKINKCKFGVIYNKRLFVSGNEDLKNMDFHTSETNNEINEFTYFSDLDYCKYGSDSKAVVGYAVYRDGDLLVFKEGSRQEATIYRRETKLAQATDYAGNIVGEDLGEETYPCYPVNNAGGTGAISSKAICNFFGETLAVTEEGVKAITNKDNVFNNSKYTFDVSTHINPRIKNESLDYSFIYPYQECVFLRTNRGIYVGYHDIRTENEEYEWYFINNISADLFFELDKQLYFANNNGGIYRFNRNKKIFVDKKRIFVGVGGTTLSIDESNNKVIVSGTYDKNIKEGNTFHVIADLDDLTALPTTQIHAALGDFINVNTRTNRMGQAGFDQTLYLGVIDPEHDTIEVKPYKADGTINQSRLDTKKVHFYEGIPVYLDHIVGHGLKVKANTLYYLSTYDSDRYNVVDEFGNVMELAGVETMRISYNIGENRLTKIHNVSDYLSTGKQFELLGDHNEVLDLIYYNDKDDCQYKGVITIPENIEAYYVTPPYVLGSIVNMKTVWSVAVTNDTGMASEMEIGYLSSHKQSDYGLTIATSSGSKQWDFNSEFTFEKVQFVNDGLPHTYQRYKVIPRVGFMRFLFRNNEKSNLIVSSLSIIYSISLFTKGER